jgi:glycine oxidase
MTPDGLPVISRDPEFASLIYACGHGKNGILLAPLTAECVAALVGGVKPPMDLASFAVERFV